MQNPRVRAPSESNLAEAVLNRIKNDYKDQHTIMSLNLSVTGFNLLVGAKPKDMLNAIGVVVNVVENDRQRADVLVYHIENGIKILGKGSLNKSPGYLSKWIMDIIQKDKPVTNEIKIRIFFAPVWE